MNDFEQERLEFERAVGEQKAIVWEEHIKPFFDAKKADLFIAFQNLSVSDNKGMTLVKLHSYALDSLEAEFKSYIETGKMADMTLSENEEKNDGRK